MTLQKVEAGDRVGTYDEIVGEDGAYFWQRGICLDWGNSLHTGTAAVPVVDTKGGAEMRWNGAAWVWNTDWMTMAMLRAARTAPNDLLDNEVFVITLPKLGACDRMRISGLLTSTNSSNQKLFRVGIGSVGNMQLGYNADVKGKPMANLYTEFRNKNNAGSQEWMTNSESVIGLLSGTMQTTGKATGTAGVRLALSLQKTVAGQEAESMVLQWADFELKGGGFA